MSNVLKLIITDATNIVDITGEESMPASHSTEIGPYRILVKAIADYVIKELGIKIDTDKNTLEYKGSIYALTKINTDETVETVTGVKTIFEITNEEVLRVNNTDVVILENLIIFNKPGLYTVEVLSNSGNLLKKIQVIVKPRSIYLGRINPVSPTNSEFALLSKDELLSYSTEFLTTDNIEADTSSWETGLFGTFFIMAPEDLPIKGIRFRYDPDIEKDDLDTFYKQSDIEAGLPDWKSLHENIEINGISYKILGYRHKYWTDDSGNKIYKVVVTV